MNLFNWIWPTQAIVSQAHARKENNCQEIPCSSPKQGIFPSIGRGIVQQTTEFLHLIS